MCIRRADLFCGADKLTQRRKLEMSDDEWGEFSEKSSVRVLRTTINEIAIADIWISTTRRSVDKTRVLALSKAIARDGLQYPITLCRRRGMGTKSWELVAGGHRLAAFKLLGLKKIPATIILSSQAEAWCASENLHRSELSALRFAEELVNYANATTDANQIVVGKRQPDKGISRVARELGFSRRTVERAFSRAGLPTAVKESLVANNLDDNGSFLSEIVKINDSVSQLRRIREKSETKPAAPIVTQKKEPSNPLNPTRDFLPDFQALERAWKHSDVCKLYTLSKRNVKIAFLKKIGP